MSMPIQRQSEQFSAFESGPRWERDKGSRDIPKGLAALINTSGPRITGGMLNTRTASQAPEPSRGSSCEYCGKHGHDWKIHPEAHSDIADWEREKHGMEFPFGDHTEGIYPDDDDHDGSAWPGKHGSRVAVNIPTTWDPMSHAYGRQGHDPLFGEFGHDGYDYEGVSPGQYRQMTRGYDPDTASQMAREDEDDESGYNWGPEPLEHHGARTAGFDDTHSIITEFNTAKDTWQRSKHPQDAEYMRQVHRELVDRAMDGDEHARGWIGRDIVPPSAEQLEKHYHESRRAAVSEDYSDEDDDIPSRRDKWNRKREDEIRMTRELLPERPYQLPRSLREMMETREGRRGSGRHPFDRTAGTIRRAFSWQPVTFDPTRHDPGHRRFFEDIEHHKAPLENGHELHTWGYTKGPDADDGWHWAITDPNSQAHHDYVNNYEQSLDDDTDWDVDPRLPGSPPPIASWLASGGLHAGYSREMSHKHGGPHFEIGSDGHIPTNEDAKSQAQNYYQQMFPMGSNTGGHDSGTDYSDLNSYMRHLESMRLAGVGIDERSVRSGPMVDMPLYEQDPDDAFSSRPYSGSHCPDCGRPARWVGGPGCHHHHTAAAAPAVDPAQMQAPPGGGFLPGHRVAVDWRGKPVPGTVTSVEDPHVWVRYDHDGQHLPEEPQNLRLL